MKQRAKRNKPDAHRRLMREIYWHRMLGNLMLQLPWVKRTSPMVLHRVRKMNACCVALHQLEADLPQLRPAEKTAA